MTADYERTESPRNCSCMTADYESRGSLIVAVWLLTIKVEEVYVTLAVWLLTINAEEVYITLNSHYTELTEAKMYLKTDSLPSRKLRFIYLCVYRTTLQLIMCCIESIQRMHNLMLRRGCQRRWPSS